MESSSFGLIAILFCSWFDGGLVKLSEPSDVVDSRMHKFMYEILASASILNTILLHSGTASDMAMSAIRILIKSTDYLGS